MTAPEYSLDDAIDELQRRWSQQQCIRVEDLLKRYPNLSQNQHAVLDLIYAEVLLCEETGQSANEADYTRRFPELNEQIARQFQLHRALGDTPGQAELTTAKGSMTIPIPVSDETQTAQGFPQIEGFEIIELAGRGSSGAAYRAFDKQLKRIVAIKLLHTNASKDSLQRQRLVREAEAAASLVHPGIVRVHQIGENNGDPYLVMEFIDGKSLAEVLQEGPLSVERAIDVVLQVARAIDYAHDSGIIHRDLKPANVLLDGNDHPHICDFGLARQIESEFTLHSTGDVMGTPAYMSPEQARGEDVTVASDVYSLGAVLYQCLTGRPPFLASTPWEIMTQVMTDDPPTLRQLNTTLPRDIETICCVALRKLPARRYASAAILADDLVRFRSGRPIKARPVGRIEKILKLCKRHPAISTLVSVSLIALTALAIVSTISSERISNALGDTKQALGEAETQRDVAFSAMKRLVFQVYDDLEQREASVEAREQVLESAIEGLQRLLDTKGDKSDIHLAMSVAKTRLGFILSQQGRIEEAEQEYLQAVEIAKVIKTDEAFLQAARGYSSLANFYLSTNRPDDAIEMSEMTTATLDQCTHDAFSLEQAKLLAAQAKSHLGNGLFLKGRYSEALAVRQESVQLNKELLDQAPNDRSTILQFVESGIQTAVMLIQLGRYDEAEEYLTEAIPLLKLQSEKSTEDQTVEGTLYRALHYLGSIQFTRMQFKEALGNFTEATVGYQHMVDIEPERPSFRLKLGALHRDAGLCLQSMGQIEESIRQTTKSIVEFQKGIELGGQSYRVQRFAMIGSYSTLTDLHLRKGDVPAAIAAIQQAAKVAQPIVAEYGLQQAVDGLLYHTECLAGILGQDSSADAEDIECGKRAFEVYQAALNKDFGPLLANEQQLRSDIDTVDRPAMKSGLVLFLCQDLGMYFDFISSEGEHTAEEIASIQSKAIEAAKMYSGLPDIDSQFYLKIPELTGLRATAQFRSEFSAP